MSLGLVIRTVGAQRRRGGAADCSLTNVSSRSRTGSRLRGEVRRNGESLRRGGRPHRLSRLCGGYRLTCCLQQRRSPRSQSLATFLTLVHHGNVITVASHPTDLAAWDQDKNPYYSEVLGEAEPVLDMTHATVLPPGGPTVQSTTSTPVYEYWWTMGHGGAKPEHHHLFEGRKKLDLWHHLEDVAARVTSTSRLTAGGESRSWQRASSTLLRSLTSRTGPRRRLRSGNACSRSFPVPDRWPRRSVLCPRWAR